MNPERLKSLGLSQSDIARHLGIQPSAVSMKVGGDRPWKRDEIDAVLALARQKDPTVTYESLFGTPEPAEQTA